MLAFADHRMSIGAVVEEQRHNRLELQVPRLILVSFQLGDDGALLLLELVPGIDAQVVHAVRFDLQGKFPVAGRQIEMENGVVFRGVGVVIAAVALREPVDIAGLDLLSPLEHEVFEVVGQPGVIEILIRRADLVSHHGAYHRRLRNRL